jgi:E3 ubiquitin-protein ligase HECTD1
MWLCDDENDIESSINQKDDSEVNNQKLDLGDGVKPVGFYVNRSNGLFPAPLPQNSDMCEKVSKLFWFLGVFIAKVLQDGRLVDLPLSNSFLELLCHNKILSKSKNISALTNKMSEDIMISSIMSEESDLLESYSKVLITEFPETNWYEGVLSQEHLSDIDTIRAEFLKDLQELVQQKQNIESNEHLSKEERNRMIDDLKLKIKGSEVLLEDLALTFTFLPSSKVYGFDAIDLIPNGSQIDVNINNLEEYCDLTLNFCLQDGIAKQLQAFHKGFCEVFPLNKLAAFTPDEARLMICGEQHPEWSKEDLLNYTEPKLGYSKDSPGFLRFVNVLMSFTGPERKAFLQFTTGCSSLPPGGLSNLHPRLTIVRKVDAGEGSYPSVNTCVHYLKLPDYPTEEILKDRLLTATREKGFHFN